MIRKTHRFRIVLVATASLLTFGLIEARLYKLQIREHARYAELARSQHGKSILLHPRRGDILDRNGQVLATSTFYDTVWINPAALRGSSPPEGLAARLGRLFKRPVESIETLLSRPRRTLLQRKAPPDTADALRLLEADLGLPDDFFEFEKESKRLYPMGDLAGPVLGFAGLDPLGDNVGLEGLELQYDAWLRGEARKVRVPVNSLRRGLAPMKDEALKSTFGRTLVLTLDSQIQHYAQQALRRGGGVYQAKAAVAVVMDVATGAILALANWPDFDPNQFNRTLGDQRRNRALTDPIEIGSVMKILTAAILLDQRLLHPDEPIACENGAWQTAEGRRISDDHPLGVVPYREAFAYSSNIAHVKLALRLDDRVYDAALRRFGLGEPTGLDLPGEASGLLRPVEQWSALSKSSLPIGYETSLTAIQVVMALAAVANGGTRMRPFIVRRILAPDGQAVKVFEPQPIGRVASPETCAAVLELLGAVTEEGTGKNVVVPGYRVGGKTGTAKKTPGGRSYVASFAGLIPLHEPRLAVYVYVDEPDPRLNFYGGKVAGPIFAEIAQHAVRILGIPPDFPPELRSTDAQAADVAAAPPVTPGPGSSEPGTPLSGLGRDDAWMTAADPPWADASVIADPKPGRMPNFMGRTILEALELARAAGAPVKLMGSGVAVRQSPPAGQPLIAGEVGRVIFQLPSRGAVGRIGLRRAPEPALPVEAMQEGSATAWGGSEPEAGPSDRISHVGTSRLDRVD